MFGAIDHLAVPVGTRARRIGALHGVGNVVVVVLFAGSWLLRTDEPGHSPGTVAFLLALVGALLATGTGCWAESSSTGSGSASHRTRGRTPRRPSRPASG